MNISSCFCNMKMQEKSVLCRKLELLVVNRCWLTLEILASLEKKSAEAQIKLSNRCAHLHLIIITTKQPLVWSLFFLFQWHALTKAAGRAGTGGEVEEFKQSVLHRQVSLWIHHHRFVSSQQSSFFGGGNVTQDELSGVQLRASMCYK